MDGRAGGRKPVRFVPVSAVFHRVPPHRAAQALAWWLGGDDARFDRLARAAGVSPGFIDRVLDGEMVPEARVMAAIEAETQGAVTQAMLALPPLAGGWDADAALSRQGVA